LNYVGNRGSDLFVNDPWVDAFAGGFGTSAFFEPFVEAACNAAFVSSITGGLFDLR
jgi:hypothetical protein